MLGFAPYPYYVTRLFRESEFCEELHRWLYIINNMGDDKLQDCPFEGPLYHDFFEQGLYNKMTAMEKKEYEKSIRH